MGCWDQFLTTLSDQFGSKIFVYGTRPVFIDLSCQAIEQSRKQFEVKSGLVLCCII